MITQESLAGIYSNSAPRVHPHSEMKGSFSALKSRSYLTSVSQERLEGIPSDSERACGRKRQPDCLAEAHNYEEITAAQLLCITVMSLWSVHEAVTNLRFPASTSSFFTTCNLHIQECHLSRYCLCSRASPHNPVLNVIMFKDTD